MFLIPSPPQVASEASQMGSGSISTMLLLWREGSNNLSEALEHLLVPRMALYHPTVPICWVAQ